MKPLLVRDVMTIGVPICREWESCADVASRLARDAGSATAIVVLNRDAAACGWLSREQLMRLAQQDAARGRPMGDVMDEDIPTTPPDIPATAAAQLMRDRGVDHLFLMHTWPGELRPSAVVSLRNIEKMADAL